VSSGSRLFPLNFQGNGKDVRPVGCPISVLGNPGEKTVVKSVANALHAFPVAENLHQHRYGQLRGAASWIAPTQSIGTAKREIHSGIKEPNFAITHYKHLFIREIGISVFFAPPNCEPDKCNPGCIVILSVTCGSAQTGAYQRIDNFFESLALSSYIDHEFLLMPG
jgi:hypothetical protein